MLFSRFCSRVQELLKAELPAAADVELSQSEGSFRIMVRTPADVLYPSIPLNRFFDEYHQGLPLNKIVRRILSLYAAETMHPFCTAADFDSREVFTASLGFRPASLRLHRGLLPVLPHAVFHEMLFFFTAALPGEGSDPELSIVTKEIGSRFRMSDEALKKAALIASGERLPAVISPLSAYLDKLAKDVPEAERRVAGMTGNGTKSSFYVLTNEASRFGAAVILYPGMAEKLCRRFGSCYLLPSSVHEFLVLPDTGADKRPELKRLIRSANRSLDDSLLVLSDELYYCDPANGLQRC